MSSKLETAIWSCDTGQPVPYFDRYQLTTTGMPKIKGRRYKPISWSLAAILCDSDAIAITVRTHEQYC